MRPSVLATILTTALALSAAAQQTTHVERPQPVPPRNAPERKVELPVTRVSLYKNGVGFFEHTGIVHGNASVTIDFTSAQLNDVLQSLTAIDLNGGRISGAGYNSTSPLDQQLRSLSLGLPQNTTFAQFLGAVRGARVEVTGSGAAFTGRLMDVESHEAQQIPGKDGTTITETFFISVISDAGALRIFPMTPALSVRLLEAPLHADVNHYLQLLDGTRNQGLRHLTLDDKGTGARELHVSYISEVPIWKSTYRILFTEKSSGGPFMPQSHRGMSGEPQTPGPNGEATTTATLQGWSVVDNTTGVDWINVHLSLIAGAPQSFIQPLSQPIYSRRPEIPIATQAQLTPQTYDSGVEMNGAADISPLQAAHASPAPPPRMMSRAYGLGQGSGDSLSMLAVTAGAVENLPTYQEEARDSLAVNTTTAAFDDFFSYNITDPVTIRTNESALVPILQAKIDADRVTLVSSDGNRVSQPLRALWVTNTTGLTLDRGSFSIVENGNFGGEGLLDPIHAGEKRLLSYAADEAVHVSTESPLTTKHVDHVTASKGVIRLHAADIREVTYQIHNAAAEPRTVVLEHPKFDKYKLEDTNADGSPEPVPTETTANTYRFREVVAPGQTLTLHIGERHRGVNSYQLARSNDQQMSLILHDSGDDPKVQAALAPIFDARRRVADAQTAVNQTKAILDNLRKDEDRQRSNITALQAADHTSRDRFVHDLNQTEDKITAAQTELTARTATLDAAKADLANRIDNLNLDVQVNGK